MNVLSSFINDYNLALVGVYLVSGSVQASQRIHEGVLARLFEAGMDLFERQPLGRITNRLSVDIEGIDFRLNQCGGWLASRSFFVASEYHCSCNELAVLNPSYPAYWVHYQSHTTALWSVGFLSHHIRSREFGIANVKLLE